MVSNENWCRGWLQFNIGAWKGKIERVKWLLSWKVMLSQFLINFKYFHDTCLVACIAMQEKICLNLQLNWEMRQNVSIDVLAPVAETIQTEWNREEVGGRVEGIDWDILGMSWLRHLPMPKTAHWTYHLKHWTNPAHWTYHAQDCTYTAHFFSSNTAHCPFC